jgi:hypothetical protein
MLSRIRLSTRFGKRSARPEQGHVHLRPSKEKELGWLRALDDGVT